MQPLFLEPSVTFEKTAAETALSEDPNAWSHEVLQELYKQAPYIADFSPHVVMEKVDGEQGYGLGYIEVTNQSEAQMGTNPEASAAAGIREVRVPVVIKDGMLCAFDLLIAEDSKVLPLTESRLRAAIFRPQPFDMTSRTPGDQSMIGQLYPPYRQSYGFGGGGISMDAGMGKQGSALEEYLEKEAMSWQEADQFLDPSYLHAPDGAKQGRYGKVSKTAEYKEGMLDDFIQKNAEAKEADVVVYRKRPEEKAHPAVLPASGAILGGAAGFDVAQELGSHRGKGALIGAGIGGVLGAGGTYLQHRKADRNRELNRTNPIEVGRFRVRSEGGAPDAPMPVEKAANVSALRAVGRPAQAAHNAVRAKTLADTAASRAKAVAERLKVKKASLLEAIRPTINEGDLDLFKSAISDPSLQPALLKNAAAVTPALECLLTDVQRPKFASAFPHLIRPSVVQVIRKDEDYAVKTASHAFWAPEEERLTRAEVLQRFGEKVVLAADLSGAVTMADGADALEEGDHTPDSGVEGAAPITEPGVYRVQTAEGGEAIGYVIPNLIDIDGTPLPLALFTNGQQSIVQADIIGVPAEDDGSIELPSGEKPQGYGVFASESPEGIQATVPLTLSGSIAGIGDEPMSYQAKSFSGENLLVSIQPNIAAVVGEYGKMLIPGSWQWVPLGQSDEVALESQEENIGKTASMRRSLASVDVVSGGGTFSVRGPLVDKLAHDEREMLSLDETMFLLAGFGVNQDYGVRKLAQAISGEAPVRVKVGRVIKLAEHQKQAAMASAEEVLKLMPALRFPLFKEAAVIGDPSAVDTVLSLGFLNPENLNTFIGYVPVLEDSQAKLCDILLASRLGSLIDTPEGAIERAVRSLEAVLEGLKALAFQTN